MSKLVKSVLSVEGLLNEYKGNMLLVDRRLKVLSSNKCNLKKNKEGYVEKDYNLKLSKIVLEYDMLKEVKEVLNGKKVVNYIDYSEEEIKELSYDSLEKGIRSLSSIKCRNRMDMKKIEEIEKKEVIYKKYKELNNVNNKGLIKKEELLKCIKVIEELKVVKKEEVIKMLNLLLVDVK